MKLPESYTLKLLSSLSPSRYQPLQECALREVWTSNGHPPLLPLAPEVHLGTIIHQVFEKVSNLNSIEFSKFEEIWGVKKKGVEKSMESSGLQRRFVPLANHIHRYKVKKIQCYKLCQKVVEGTGGKIPFPSTSSEGARVAETEKWLRTPDGKIVGQADRIELGGKGAVIEDFKTGRVENEKGSIKETYKKQLKLYAALYHVQHGEWPHKLLLMTLDGNERRVNFSPEECEQLLADAKGYLDQVNNQIQQFEDLTARETLASPSEDNCKFCSFRPVCPAYWNARIDQSDAPWPSDIKGIIVSKNQLGNELWMFKISPYGHRDKYVWVRGLDTVKFPVLKKNSLKKIALFSLISEASKNKFKAGVYTAIYEI